MVGFRLICILLAGLTAPVPAADPESNPVVRIERWIEGGARVDWSRQGEWLAYDKAGADGRYDVYVTSTDRLAERCLTCDMYALRKDNVLNPVWHPAGERLIVQVQSHPKRLKFVADPLQLLTPDRALHSEFFDIDRKGKHFTLLTRFAASGTAVLDPHFSFDGERLLWSERIKARKGRYGAWQLRSARFQVNRVGAAQLKKIRSHTTPTDALIVPQGYTPDDRGALVTANLEPGQPPDALDLYRLRFDGGEPERLTHSRGGAEEFARLSPTGRHVAFTSNAEIRGTEPDQTVPPSVRRELWLMDADGSNKRRLTFFNDPTSDHSLGHTYVGDLAWSPSGDQIAVHVLWGSRDSDRPREAVYRLHLDPSFRR
ncbi:MAG: hypothetical protein OXG74_07170 [Acidobacteria bacterium]|nr:hypothetical protein [Acidobacteriota bacterium]